MVTPATLAGPERRAIYERIALPHVPRLLALLDREPASPNFGCFDRDHWSWKFRDFPLGMMQAGMYPLALLWHTPFADNPYRGSERLFDWIVASMEWTVARQRRNGAFDAFSPNEQNIGPTLGIAHALSEACRLLGPDLPDPLRERVLNGLRRACEFGRTRDEDHGFISNHQAMFATAFLNTAELLGEARYREAGEAVIDRILRHQSPDGWYREYGGPDPGYESLGIFHLAIYWSRTKSARLLESLTRSAAFHAHCLHPDGSIGGVYGSRHTRLYCPGGLEILAAHARPAATVARFMAARLERANVVTPATVDAENLPVMLYTYLEAALAAGASTEPDPPAPPCEVLLGQHMFADSGIVVAGTPHYYAVVATGKGGACRISDRPSGKTAYEDAGYLVRSQGHEWSSQLIGPGRGTLTGNGREVALATVLAEVRVEALTPLKFLVLRLLNLTLFRSEALGSWVRRRVVGRLITDQRPGPIRLNRTIRFDETAVRFDDRLEAAAPVPADEVILAGSFTAIHMGSARYFHPSELEGRSDIALPAAANALRTTGRAAFEFSVRFGDGRPELVTHPQEDR